MMTRSSAAASIAPAEQDDLDGASVIIPAAAHDSNRVGSLIERLSGLRERLKHDLNVVVVPVAGADGTCVLDALCHARGGVIACLAADIADPEEAVLKLLSPIRGGAEFVVGSLPGPNAWWNRAMRLLARPLANVSDPLTGTFAISRETLMRARDLSLIGNNVTLELLVRSGCQRVVEVPIQRSSDQGPAETRTFAQHLTFLRHLRRLYIAKHDLWPQLTQFLIVGGLGTVVNLGMLTLSIALGVPSRAAIALAIVSSMCFNFMLNRRFSFSLARTRSWPRQFLAFVSACSIGTLINYAVALLVLSRFPTSTPQIAALTGIAAGTFFNFTASRHFVFRGSSVRRTMTR